jgi:hypothetical protein
MGYKLERCELEQELREQAEALRSSAIAYDCGHLWEAKRLAATAYILVHDGGRNSRSLLGQLGLRGDFLSSADQNSLIPLAFITGSMKADGGGPTFSPHLDKRPTAHRWLPFKKWYKEIVFESGRLRTSRMNLICTFRHQAGGAHVDGEIKDDAFRWLTTNSPYHIDIGPPTDKAGNPIELPAELEGFFSSHSGPVPNGHYASMRQIAWEIDQTLRALGY